MYEVTGPSYWVEKQTKRVAVGRKPAGMLSADKSRASQTCRMGSSMHMYQLSQPVVKTENKAKLGLGHNFHHIPLKRWCEAVVSMLAWLACAWIPQIPQISSSCAASAPAMRTCAPLFCPNM